jgi:AcrR family transcriptional regulator
MNRYSFLMESPISVKKFIEKKQAISEQAVRESICQAALDVLSSQGLEKLTMQRVAASANIATGTLYNYFADKDALLVYAAERLFGQIRERIRKAMGENTNPRVKLLEMIRAIFAFFNENISYFQFLDRAQIYSKINLEVKEYHIMQERAMIAEVLREGIEGRGFKKVNVDLTAHFFQRAIVGTICVKPELEVFDPDKEAKSLAEMFYTFLE